MYIVDISLVRAEDLAASDYAFAGGKSDPYVTLRLGASTQKSSCISSNLNPVWNPIENFSFKAKDPKTEYIEVRVYDYDSVSCDDLIGSKIITLAQFEKKKSSEILGYSLDIPDEFASQNRKSAIYLEIKMTSEEDYDKTFELWENQRYNVLQGWTYDKLVSVSNARKRWSSVEDSIVSSDIFDEVAPKIPAYYDTDGWTLDISQGDDEGWTYAVTFAGPWHKDNFTLAVVRRRKWINRCQAKNNNNTF